MDKRTHGGTVTASYGIIFDIWGSLIFWDLSHWTSFSHSDSFSGAGGHEQMSLMGIGSFSFSLASFIPLYSSLDF
jgi:hypothetical protein